MISTLIFHSVIVPYQVFLTSQICQSHYCGISPVSIDCGFTTGACCIGFRGCGVGAFVPPNGSSLPAFTRFSFDFSSTCDSFHGFFNRLSTSSTLLPAPSSFDISFIFISGVIVFATISQVKKPPTFPSQGINDPSAVPMALPVFLVMFPAV